MRPELPILLILSLSSSLLHPAASLCVPRTSSHPLNHLSLAPAPTPASSTPSPSPPPAQSQSPPPSSGSSLSDDTDPMDGLVKSICGHTDYPDVCLSSIQSLLPSLGSVDPASILSLHIKALTSQTETVRALAAKLAADPKAVPQDKDSYGTVLEFYDDALDNLDASSKALAAHDKGTLNSMLSALIDNYSDVEDTVGGSEKPSPLSAHDNVMTKMTSNSLAIAQLV